VICSLSKSDEKFYRETILCPKKMEEEGLKDNKIFPEKKERMNSDRICGIVRLWHGNSGTICLRGKISEIMSADPTASHIIVMGMLKRFCMYRSIQYLFELMIKLELEMQSCEVFEMHRAIF
jgi:hypothetical protein